jgi:hypothetical protein
MPLSLNAALLELTGGSKAGDLRTKPKELWYSQTSMRRGVHIAVALLAIFVLARPLDCFSSGKFDKKAADCCKKGKCSPSNSDDCCKGTVPDGNQLATSKAADHSQPILDVVMADVPNTVSQLSAISQLIEVHPPPGSPPNLRLNRPLLI